VKTDLRKRVRILISTDLIFILLLCVSGSLSGVLSNIAYYLSFVLAASFFFIAEARLGEKTEKVGFKLGKAQIGALLPLIPIAVGLIFVTSFVTSLVLSFFGFTDETVLEGNILYVILIHALLPSVLEELVFRYLPLRLIGRRSPWVTVWLSALLFGLVHTNLFQMPYAIVAGCILMALDIAFDSIIPSVTVHLVNNILSVLWMTYSTNSAFAIGYLTALASLSMICVAVVIMRRRSYRSYFSRALERGEGYKPGTELLAIVIPTVILAVSALFI
jgi:membrane protease YdiL (CAAX protease family)